MSKRESIELTDKSSDFRYLMVMVLIALFLQAFALIFNALLFAVISVIVVSMFAYIRIQRSWTVSVLIASSFVGPYFKYSLKFSIMMLILTSCVSMIVIMYRPLRRDSDITRRG